MNIIACRETGTKMREEPATGAIHLRPVGGLEA